MNMSGKKHKVKIAAKSGKRSRVSAEQKKNRIRDVQINYQAINIAGRKYIQSILKDITEHKKLLERLKDSNEHLQKTLTEQKRTHKEVVRHERLMALGQMISGVVHDFNNALGPILGYSNLLINKPEILDNKKELIKILTDMHTAATDASKSVRRMKDFYKPADPLELEMLNIGDAIKNAVSITQSYWKEEAEKKGINIRVKTDIKDALWAKVNGSLFRESLMNLIFNAVEAMPRGGTIIIQCYIHESGEGVVIEVRDTGTGMKENVRLHCIELFFTTKKKSGAGLGLAMVHGFVLRSKGSLDIQSIPGRGTSVIIHLPLARHEKHEGMEEKTLK